MNRGSQAFSGVASGGATGQGMALRMALNYFMSRNTDLSTCGTLSILSPSPQLLIWEDAVRVYSEV